MLEVERAPVWEGTGWVVSATEESVFQGRFGMVAGHIFDSEKLVRSCNSAMLQAFLEYTGLIIGIMSPVHFTPEKECYTVLFL